MGSDCKEFSVCVKPDVQSLHFTLTVYTGTDIQPEHGVCPVCIHFQNVRMCLGADVEQSQFPLGWGRCSLE